MARRNELSMLMRRSVALLRSDGMAELLRHGLAFLGFLVGRLFFARTVYLYKHEIQLRERARFLPRLDSWELRIIHSNAEADQVAAEGLQDLRDVFVFSHRSLDKGAIAFCVYVGGELAHVGWVAVDAAGKNSVDKIPFRVAFAAKEACTGGTYTIPKFRGKGLMGYGYYERLEYLREKGFVVSRNSVTISNIASQKVHAKFNPVIYGKARYRKVLRWESWREMRLPGGPCRGMPPEAPDRSR